jgi:hypothetical protein
MGAHKIIGATQGVTLAFTRRKPELEWRYNLLICTIYVFMDACVKIDTILNLCAYSFGQQLTKYPL